MKNILLWLLIVIILSSLSVTFVKTEVKVDRPEINVLCCQPTVNVHPNTITDRISGTVRLVHSSVVS